MKRDDYLKEANVAKYIDDVLCITKNNNIFCHCYYDVDRKEKVNFTSLEDACSKYYYSITDPVLRESAKGDGNGIKENNNVLMGLRNKLLSAYKNGSNDNLLDACKMVMKWGGTDGNNKKLESIAGKKGLKEYFESVEDLISQCEVNFKKSHYDNFTKNNKIELVSNAGFTKLYSLLYDDFIIYDSRVAAALGWIYVLYSKDRQQPVPDTLRFYCMPARGGQNRNPSFYGHRFKTIPSNHAHFDSNIKANWILKEVIKRCESNFCGKEGAEALRYLESSLFMIGYDVHHPCMNSDFPPFCSRCFGSKNGRSCK